MTFPHLKDHAGRQLDQVQLTGMLMSCVIGIFPSERSRKQPVTIDMCLYLDTRKAAASANIHETIDYGGVVKEVSFILDHCEFLLIESAVEAICRHFLLTYQADHNLPSVDAVMVRISKPSALTHGIVPAVQILRRRDDLPPQSANNCRDGLALVHSTTDCSLHMFIGANGASVNIHELLPNAASVLPLGRWNLNDAPLKNRAPVHLSQGKPQFFSLTERSSARGLILIQGRPSAPGN
jgi:FolB domain-containing protein